MREEEGDEEDDGRPVESGVAEALERGGERVGGRLFNAELEGVEEGLVESLGEGVTEGDNGDEKVKEEEIVVFSTGEKEKTDEAVLSPVMETHLVTPGVVDSEGEGVGVMVGVPVPPPATTVPLELWVRVVAGVKVEEVTEVGVIEEDAKAGVSVGKIDSVAVENNEGEEEGENPEVKDGVTLEVRVVRVVWDACPDREGEGDTEPRRLNVTLGVEVS